MTAFVDEVFQRAFHAHKNGNLSEAERGYRAVLDAEPNNPNALHLLGLITFDKGEIDAALKLVEKSVQLVPEDLQWLVNYGRILSKAGNNEAAAGAYEKALFIDPRSRDAGIALGDVYTLLGKPRQALEVYHSMLSDTPDDAILKNKYADTLRTLGKTDNPYRAINGASNTNTKQGLDGEVDFVSRCGFMANALLQAGYRMRAAFYISEGIQMTLEGVKPDLEFRDLLQSWQVSTPGAMFAKMYVELMAFSMYYATPGYPERIFAYWMHEEPENPDPFLRLGLFQALQASRNRRPIPEEAIQNVRHAHELLQNERSAAALRLVENYPSLEELTVPYDLAKIWVYPTFDNVSTFVLLEKGDWFEDEIHLFRNLLKPGDSVLDLGANVGVYSLSAAGRVGTAGRVIAIEPSASTFGLLQKSAGQFGNIKAIRTAVSDASGQGVLNAEAPEMRALQPGNGNGEIVNITTVDEIAEREGIGGFDLIKMDVEGVEEKVIAGATKTLTKGNPIILYEISQGRDWESNLNLANLFRKHGYESYYLSAPRKTITKYRDGVKLDGFVFNMIALRPDALGRFDPIVKIEE